MVLAKLKQSNRLTSFLIVCLLVCFWFLVFGFWFLVFGFWFFCFFVFFLFYKPRKLGKQRKPSGSVDRAQGLAGAALCMTQGPVRRCIHGDDTPMCATDRGQLCGSDPG